MPSEVFFANLRATNFNENRISKVQRLFDAAGFGDLIGKDDLTAIKIHFGERGNDGYINPVYVRQVVDKIKAKGGKPYITDTNTLYRGSRFNAVDHLTVAIEHGFDYAVVNAPLIISDGLTSQNYTEVKIEKKHFDSVKIASDILHSKSMIVMSHFKLHEIAGFGGALKNLAMGCAPAAGKKDQHQFRPTVNEEKCVGCGRCLEECAHGALSLVDGKAFIDKKICVGCGACVGVCPIQAIEIDEKVEIPNFIERMTEYAYGSVLDKKEKVGYINFITNVTPFCDCYPWSDAPLVPDIGILSSRDPIALDKACYDLINQQQAFHNTVLEHNHAPGEDKFLGLRKGVDGLIQIRYGEQLGMGSSDYKLIQI